MRDAYRRGLRAIAMPNTGLAILLEHLPSLGISPRKGILTLTRVQQLPTPGTLAYLRLRDELSTTIAAQDTSGGFLPLNILTLCQSMTELTSPTFSGFLSMMLRNAPFDDLGDVYRTLEAGISKEIKAALDTYCPMHFDWTCLFGPSSSFPTPLAPGYPVDPSIHGAIRSRLLTAKRRLSGTTLYPQIGTKTIGRTAARNLRRLSMQHLCYEEEPTTAGLERLYHRSGVQVHGSTEIRWAWKYNDLKPRVYYARGPDVFYASRFIQPIFNVLVDAFPATNRFERYHHASLTIEEYETAFIYDYASFTSTLHEIRNFTAALAEFFDDTYVTIVDTYTGPQEVCLRDLLLDYNAACNEFPTFDVSRFEDPDDEEELRVHNCGMLGVPGNISSCTLLHGLHLMVLLRTLMVKVVGDDAFGKGEIGIDDREELVQNLRNIGDVSLSKSEWWMPGGYEEDGLLDTTWHYCKRPFDRLGQRLIVGTQYIFPPIAVLLGFTDSFHSTPAMGLLRRHKRAASQLCAFVRQFQDAVLTEDEIALIDRFVRYCVKESGLDSFSQSLPYQLVYPKRFSSSDVIGDMVESYWHSIVSIGVVTSVYPPLQRGSGFYGRVTAPLRLARQLGYAEYEMVTRSFVVRDDPDAFSDFVQRNIPTSHLAYEGHVALDCPSWILDLSVSPSPMEDTDDHYDLTILLGLDDEENDMD